LEIVVWWEKLTAKVARERERETEIGNRIGVCDLGGSCHFFFLKREECDKKTHFSFDFNPKENIFINKVFFFLIDFMWV
jgi:hypothetical protein